MENEDNHKKNQIVGTLKLDKMSRNNTFIL